MFQNMTIKFKLMLLSAITIVGFLVVVITLNYQLNNLEHEYKKSDSINQKLSNLKSVLIGGFMINSASAIYSLDPITDMPLKTIKKGIQKVSQFSKNNNLIDTAILNNFLSYSNQMLKDATKNQYITPDEIKANLKNWRALKKDIFKQIKSLKKDVKISKQEYLNTLGNLYKQALLIIVTISLLSLIVALTITKTISTGIKRLHDGVINLLNEKDTSSRVNLDTKEELGDIARDFNKYLQSIEDGINEDNKLIENANLTINRVKRGWYSETISAHTSNQTLEEFKNSVNEMIIATKQHFVDINNVLEQYAQYDYRNKLVINDIEKGGVFDLLITDINKLRDAITSMLVENKQNGLTLQNSSNTLLNNVSSLSQASRQSASSLEETATALKEITNNIANNTSNVIKMATYGNDVKSSVSKGQELANQTTKSMDDINEQVTAINEAISVIDQIAFQTNILSLNAAVEAATAGEAGKGFAVVAGEVRNLASRSAEAANEIKTLVENAKNKANEGKKISDEMIEGYTHLNESITKTIDLISDVEMASKEQQAGIEQINNAVAQLDKQTQQNANIAIITKDIAEQTQQIAQDIVDDANKKEFVGKNNIKAKELNNYKIETSTATQSKQKEVNLESIKPTQAITPSNNNDDDEDEWESF